MKIAALENVVTSGLWWPYAWVISCYAALDDKGHYFFPSCEMTISHSLTKTFSGVIGRNSTHLGYGWTKTSDLKHKYIKFTESLMQFTLDLSYDLFPWSPFNDFKKFCFSCLPLFFCSPWFIPKCQQNCFLFVTVKKYETERAYLDSKPCFGADKQKMQ